MAVAEESSSYDACVGALDRVARRLRSRDISAQQYEAEALQALSRYLDTDRPEDDFGLLLHYARLPIEEHGTDPLDGDRAAIDSFDRQLQALFHQPISRVDLEDRLADIARRIAEGDGRGVDDLRDLCAHGWRDHPHIFMFRDNILLTLATAFDHGVTEALVDAVLPTRPDPGPIGSPNVFDGTMLAHTFDLLASLAATGNDVGDRAVDGLVQLTGYIETAAHAAVRLPAWRLEADHRVALLEHLESFVELLEQDPFLVPTADAHRIPHILRSVLWLSNDALHI